MLGGEVHPALRAVSAATTRPRTRPPSQPTAIGATAVNRRLSRNSAQSTSTKRRANAINAWVWRRRSPRLR
jgi:hypothetical protein